GRSPNADGGGSYGKDDDAAHRTRARDPVLHRNRRQPCRCWHHRARSAVHGHKGISSSTIARAGPMRLRTEDALPSLRSSGMRGWHRRPRTGAKLRADVRLTAFAKSWRRELVLRSGSTLSGGKPENIWSL